MQTNTYYEMHFGDNTTKAFKTLEEGQSYAKEIGRPAIDIYEVVTTREMVN